MDDPEATDNCTEVTVIQTQGLAWNTFFPTGVTTQLFEATDSAGNTAVCLFTVTVEDIQSPTVFCTDQTVYLSGTGTAEILALQIDGVLIGPRAHIGRPTDHCPQSLGATGKIADFHLQALSLEVAQLLGQGVVTRHPMHIA